MRTHTKRILIIGGVIALTSFALGIYKSKHLCFFDSTYGYNKYIQYKDEIYVKVIDSLVNEYFPLNDSIPTRYNPKRWGLDTLNIDRSTMTSQEIYEKYLLHRRMGLCYDTWRIQKYILLNEYGILWHTPAEVYRNIIFD